MKIGHIDSHTRQPQEGEDAVGMAKEEEEEKPQSWQRQRRCSPGGREWRREKLLCHSFYLDRGRYSEKPK
jgi:hypothetical protein